MQITIRSSQRALARLLVPEGLLFAVLLLLPRFPALFQRIEPLLALYAGVIAAIGAGVAWRFGRGRLLHGMVALAAFAAIPLLPQTGAARSLAWTLAPMTLALIALLPDRGIMTRGGLLRVALILAQAAVVAGVAVIAPAGADPLAELVIPGLGVVSGPAVAAGVALALLLLLSLARGDAPARGFLWATAAVLVAWAGDGLGTTYLAAAGALLLLVAALEDAHSLAYRDGLTGLPSRRALDELLQRTVRHYTVAMVDVDHFKAFNDEHGHDIGDQVLRMVAKRLSEVGGGGRAFRYGGEEFTVVFRGRSLEEVKPHLDALRESVADSGFIIRGPDRPKKKPKKGKARPRGGKRTALSVTVSVGAAERSNGSTSPEAMLKAADEALYRAKRAGRNRVVAA